MCSNNIAVSKRTTFDPGKQIVRHAYKDLDVIPSPYTHFDFKYTHLDYTLNWWKNKTAKLHNKYARH